MQHDALGTPYGYCVLREAILKQPAHTRSPQARRPNQGPDPTSRSKSTGTAAKDYDVLDHQGQKTGQQVGVRFVNLHRDLGRKEGQMALAEELGLLAQVQQMSTLVS